MFHDGSFSNNNCHYDINHWNSLFKDQLHEAWQPTFLFNCSRWSSRIDRAYLSVDARVYPELEVQCNLVPGSFELDHRPISSPIKPTPSFSSTSPPLWTWRHPAYGVFVHHLLHDLDPTLLLNQPYASEADFRDGSPGCSSSNEFTTDPEEKNFGVTPHANRPLVYDGNGDSQR